MLAYMAVRCSSLHGDCERLRLADVLQVATLLTLLCGVLLEHSRA